MQIVQTKNESLLREFKVTVPASDIKSIFQQKLNEIGQRVDIPGFRKGKIPLPVLEKRYGDSVRGEVLETVVSDSARDTITKENLRAVGQPKIEIITFKEGDDLEYKMAIELMPEFEPADLSKFTFTKQVAEVSDKDVQDALERLAKSRRTHEKADVAAANGDQIVIDFDGKVDGERKPGMKAEGYTLELGSKSFVDTFEDQLVGLKVGDTKVVKVTFPADYSAKELQGKKAEFDVTVQEVRRASESAIDDALAKSFGLDDLATLTNQIREGLGRDYESIARSKLKRQLMDKLSDAHSFPVPTGLLDAEFGAIWQRIEQEMKSGQLDEADQGKSEDVLRKEYKDIAERRVRLGLLLAEIGRSKNIGITQAELSQAILNEARRYPGQEKQVIEFYSKNAQALDSLRAPLFEEKVVDYILTQAKVVEEKVSADKLMAELED